MASSAHMSHEVVPDALPYIDQGYDETEIREMVNQLIEEETRRYRPTKNYLDFLPTPNYNAFETAIMKTEFERIANRQPMDVLSMKRYELPQPAANQKTDISAWTECVNNSMAQLEHQATRIHNLELLGEFGADAWRLHNTTLQQLVDQQQKKQAELRKHIQEINWERKTEQTKAGEELQRLETSWIELVSKNYEIERACIELEYEVEELRRRKQEMDKDRDERESKRRKVEEEDEEEGTREDRTGFRASSPGYQDVDTEETARRTSSGEGEDIEDEGEQSRDAPEEGEEDMEEEEQEQEEEEQEDEMGQDSTSV